MIKSIELVDFLSHSDTKLEFKDGVTIFVGENGAGKSSVIDAITYALFGEHTRKNPKSLIRRGTNQGYAKIEFSIRDKQYEAFRKIKNISSNYLEAKFFETTDNNRIDIASGERKQYNESMKEEVEKIIGMDYKKLQIASIVQQGELNAIIDSRAADRQELLNSIIGIDKLNIASKYMLENIKKFREKIKTDLGYNDDDIENLTRKFENYQQDIKETQPKKNQLELKQKQIQEKLTGLQNELEIETPKIDKINQLELRKNELLKYSKEREEVIQQQINENERKIGDCEGRFEIIRENIGFDIKKEKVIQAIEETIKKKQEISNQIASLKEKQILASKLQLKDNKCPVCDSTVEKLTPFFQEEHIKDEIIKLQQDDKLKEKELEMYRQKRKEFEEKVQKKGDAELILKTHSINTKEELIERFVSVEFNGFLKEYAKSGDINVDPSRIRKGADERFNDRCRGGRERGGRERGGERRSSRGGETNTKRVFINVGKMDGFENKGQLLGFLCNQSGVDGGSLGKIDLFDSFAFVGVDDGVDDALKAVKKAYKQFKKAVKANDLTYI